MPNCFLKHSAKYAGLLKPTSSAISEIFPVFCSISFAALLNLILLMNSAGVSPVNAESFLFNNRFAYRQITCKNSTLNLYLINYY